MAKSKQVAQPEYMGVTLSLLTLPFLGSLAGARSLLEGVVSLGEASEEIFRGDRLPLLNLQQQNEIEIKE